MKKVIVVLFAALLSFSSYAFAANVHELMMSMGDTFRVEETNNWNVEVKRVLTLRFADVLITPKQGYNFSMMLYFRCDTKDLSQYDTPEKIFNTVKRSSEEYLPSIIEKKITVIPVPTKGTYGYYTVFTDAKVASNTTPSPGEYKFMTLGMIRLSKDSALGFSIMTNDIDSVEYKNLLNYVYGFVKTEK